MPYDRNLDEKLFSRSWDSGNTILTVGVFSYNGGQRKLQISREVKADEGRTSFAKLGRLTKEELENILPILQEALTHLE